MHPADWALFITAFGNLGITLPVAAMAAIVVVALAGWRALLLWVAAIVLALGLVLVAKLFFIPCGALFPALGIHSPSGHAASAVAIYGGIAVLIGRTSGRGRFALFAILVLAAALASAIAVSRIVIGVHSVPEVILGSLIGLASPIVLAIGGRLLDRKAALRPWMVVLPLLPIVLLRGVDPHAEQAIDATAYWLAHRLDVCSVGYPEATADRIP